MLRHVNKMQPSRSNWNFPDFPAVPLSKPELLKLTMIMKTEMYYLTRRQRCQFPPWSKKIYIFPRITRVDRHVPCMALQLTWKHRWPKLEIWASATNVASYAGVFRGTRISSLLTNACSTEDNIPFPRLANHVVLSKYRKADLDRRSAWNFEKPSWPLINVGLRAEKVRFTQSDFRIYFPCTA